MSWEFIFKELANSFYLFGAATEYTVEVNMSTLKEEINASNQKKMDAFANSDPIAMGAVYTVDCRTMAPGKPVIHGREGTTAFFKGSMEAGIGNLVLKTDELGTVSAAGDTLYERGTFTFYKKDGTVVEEGKYVTIWKKVEGNWYNDVDIWNINH